MVGGTDRARARQRWIAAAVTLAGLALNGCTSWPIREIGELANEHHLQGPVHIGQGQDEYKLSPCACIDSEPKHPVTGQTLRAT